MQSSNKSRWKINKIGLINYWWYDEEELNFSDGRMILRGTNGSGKSVTMQSFIPLLLDGKRSAERLDPFGNRARKIEDYVLGYGDNVKDENTSYLYMEFVKDDTGNYKTVGIGLNGKKGQGVKFWGFIIKDGRRVGNDILLYKDKSNKIPLTKLELKNRIGTGGEVVDTQKEYEKIVNDNIFGFESLEEFDEFIKLLIEIRTPKLSDGKGFRPSTVIEILTNSLRPLSDEDLRPVSESIDNMNKTKEQLYFLTQSKKAIDKIKNYYEDYNKCLLYEKAKCYKEKSDDYEAEKTRKENIEKDLNNKSEELEKTKNDITEIDAKLEATKLKEKSLKESEMWRLQEKLKEINEVLKGLEKDIKEKEKQIEDKERELRKKNDELKVSEDSYNKLIDDFSDKNFEIQEQANEIFYDNYLFKVNEILENINEEFKFDALNIDLQKYIDKIKIGNEALKKLKDIETEYESKAEEIEKLKNEKDSQEMIVTKNRINRDDERTKLEDDMYIWERKNIILKLKDNEKVNIAQRIMRFGDETNFNDIIDSLRVPYNYKRQELLDSKISVNHQKREIEETIKLNKNELEEWKNKKDPEPTRTNATLESRKKLEDMGIEFLPFYQTINFKSDVDEKTKGIIESALIDMGVLDALVIEKSDFENILKGENIFVDKFLVPNPVEFRHDLTEFIDVELPNNSKISPETVVNILKTILIDETTSQNYFDESGYYKIGLVSGFADRNTESIFIGHEAKAKYRQKQIENITLKLDELNNEKQNIENEIKVIDENLDKLDMEFDCFPNKDSIESKQIELDSSIFILENKKKEIELKINTLSSMHEKLKNARLEVEEKTAKMQFPIKLESYNAASETASLLKDNLYKLEIIHNRIVSKYKEKILIVESTESLNNSLDDLRYDLNKFNFSKKENFENKKALEDVVQKSGNNLEEQMKECLDLLEKLPKDKNKLVEQKGKIEGIIKERKDRLVEIETSILISEKKAKISEDIFKQERDLGYLQIKNDDLIESRKEVLKSYNYIERQAKNLGGYYTDLVQNLKDNQEYLTDYNLTMEDVFIVNISEDENKDIIDLIKTRTRKDITCFIKGKKVNFFALMKEVNLAIEETKNLIDEDDRRLFEEILTNTVGRKIRESIYRAKEWVESMNKLMETIDTSSKLSFSLNWKPKTATDEMEMDTKELVDILNADGKLLRPDEISKVANHFRSKFDKATQKAKELGSAVPFHEIMKETLDYRMWYEFQFNFKKGNDSKKELTNNAFFKLSGGEKAMAMYIPLFAAVTSKFQSAKETAPRIISLDEAFAGVDDSNIRDMFRILTELDLEYIINSQVLWGEYDTIPSLAINELISDPENMVVTVIRYQWNGNIRELVI